MPEKTVKRRLQDCDAALASDDGPIFSTVAELVEALKAIDSRRTARRGAEKRKPCCEPSPLFPRSARHLAKLWEISIAVNSTRQGYYYF